MSESERSEDPMIAQSEEAELEAHRADRAANLFDVRRFIGALFAIYGLILTVLGIGASDEDIDQAAGINVNLWTGLAMLAVAALFLVWAFTRPLSRELEQAESESEAAGGGSGGDGERAGREDRAGGEER
jgi:hypothetical protein